MEARNGDELQEPSDRATHDLAELRSARRRLVLAADADRQWIERELHDGVHQRLVALAVKLQLASRQLETHPGDAKPLLEELGRDVQVALAELGRLAERIHPPLVGVGGLRAALRAAASNAGTPAAVDVRAEASYPSEVLSTVYLSCLGVLGHEGASVTVRDAGTALQFELAANGAWTAGLEALRDRVEALDGRVTVESEPDGTTRILGSLPLP